MKTCRYCGKPCSSNRAVGFQAYNGSIFKGRAVVTFEHSECRREHERKAQVSLDAAKAVADAIAILCDASARAANDPGSRMIADTLNNAALYLAGGVIAGRRGVANLWANWEVGA